MDAAAPPIDAGHDVSDRPDVAIDDVGVDAAIWRPAFAPTREVFNPGVVCPPFSLDYHAPARPPLAPGTVRWSYDLGADPVAVAALSAAGVTSARPSMLGLTGAPSGDFTAVFNYDTEVAVAADGAFGGYARVRALHSSYVSRAPHARANARVGALSRDYTTLYYADDLEEREILPGVTPLVRALEPRVAESMPVVLPADGAVVWLAGADLLVSTCLADGSLRWAIRYDPPPADSRHESAAFVQGLGDGTIIAQVGVLVRVSSDGDILAQREAELATIVGGSQACGLVATYPGRVEWWDASTLDVVGMAPSYDSLPPQPGARENVSALVVDAACQLVVMRQRTLGTETHQALIQIAAGHDPRVVELPYFASFAPPIPLVDGYVLLSDTPIRVSRYGMDASLIWSVFPPVAQVGSAFVPLANVVMPDGTLYAATGSTLGDGARFIAVELGAQPAPFVWDQAGLNWARTSSALP